MQKGKASTTAGDAAGARALHTLFEQPVILDDPFALDFASPNFRRIANNRLLRFFVMRFIFSKIRPVAGQVLARARYAEDLLHEAVAQGMAQYVIVGAGYDSFALRNPSLENQINIYEIDHPDTQASKRQKFEALGLETPDMVEYAPVDFEVETVADGLARSGFASDQPAFFSWLGTVPYLTRPATESTLSAIARFSAPGSRIVFDYLLPEYCIPQEELKTTKALKKFTEQRGEPLIGELVPQELPAFLESLGWRLEADLDVEAQAQRYFTDRDDGLRPWAASRFAYAVAP
ncbi:MAG: SAM-dependent methyltransferase [Pseudomonadota bacterium]